MSMPTPSACVQSSALLRGDLARAVDLYRQVENLFPDARDAREFLTKEGLELRERLLVSRDFEEADEAILQAEVDVLGGQFRAAVGAARGVSAETVKGWADQQRGFIGADAVAAGLADSVVGTLEDAVAVMRAKVGGGSAGSGGGLNKQTKTTRAGGAAPALKHTVRTGRSGRMELSELMAMEGGSALAELLRRQGAESAAPKPATIDELEGAVEMEV
jgi:ClpP class serine protease